MDFILGSKDIYIRYRLILKEIGLGKETDMRIHEMELKFNETIHTKTDLHIG